MPSRRDRALLAAASTYILLSERKRRYWVRPSLQSKKVYSLTDLLTDLRADDTDPITGEINESGWITAIILAELLRKDLLKLSNLQKSTKPLEILT